MLEPLKIGCAVDFSGSSRRALAESCELARRIGAAAELTLLHVSEGPVRGIAGLRASRSMRSEIDVRDARRTLESWRVEAERLSGRSVTAVLRSGDPGDEILRLAQERGLDLLVVANDGRGELKTLVLGSVARQVTRRAPCPVLVARRHEPSVQVTVDPEELDQYR